MLMADSAITKWMYMTLAGIQSVSNTGTPFRMTVNMLPWAVTGQQMGRSHERAGHYPSHMLSAE